MIDKNITKKLKDYGLSENEAKTYCSALFIEDATADKIAKNSDLNRTTCYPILERLKEMGLISQAKKKGKTVFRSAQPEKFLDLIDEKKQAIAEIIPLLRSHFEISRGKPDVRFYEGIEGLKTVFSSILSEAEEILVFGEGESFLKAIPGWTENYVHKRAAQGIRTKIILRASPYVLDSIKKLQKNEQEKKMVKIRVLPEAYKIDCSSFDVYSNKVVLYSFQKQNNAVVIESNIISQLMKTVFNILWETSEKYENLLK
ncbi:hypothetical protein GF382_02455 [Candidatus Falkowbacteria bacterium]|nr:hypothetical protein [Candidatus Falkowbacteria bacterium]